MAHLPLLITDLALILLIAGITTLICKKLKQPVIIGYILAGFLLSPMAGFFPMFVGDAEEIEILAEIGVIFLMFSLGLEFNLHKLAKVGVSGTTAATIQIVGMVFLGYIIGLLLGWSATDSLFLGGMLSMSSTIITVKAIEDSKMRQSKFAGLAIGTLIIEDIAAIFLMLILSTVSVSSSGGSTLLMTIITLLLYLVVWLILGIFIVPSFIRKIQPLLNDETLLIVTLAMCFGMVWMANALGFSSALGAFMAGSLLAGTNVAKKTEIMVTPCKDLFVAVFFVSVGFLVNPATLLEYIVPILILIVATIVGKILFLTISYLLTKQSLHTAVHCAFSQTQIGEFSFVIASLGLSLGVTGHFLYPVIVAVALITTFTTPFLLRGAPAFTGFLEKRLPTAWVKAIESNNQNDDNDDDTAKYSDDALVWRRYLKHYATRTALYTMIIGAILVIGRQLLPVALSYFPYTATKFVLMALLYLCMLPFLPQVLISHDPDFTALWMKNNFNKFPLLVLVGLRVAITTTLLVLLPIMFFDNIHYWLLLLIIPFAVLGCRSKKLRGSYLTIAAKFMANLNEQQLKEANSKNKLLWSDENLKVMTAEILPGSAWIGHNLAELAWGRIMHLNIISIRRGKKIIHFPAGDEYLQEKDILAVYGAGQFIENFHSLYAGENFRECGDGRTTLYDFILGQDEIPEKDQLFCYGIKIQKASELVGKNIRDAGFRQNHSCFVIGVERELLPIRDPSPNFILLAEDLVWVLCTEEVISRLLQEEGITARKKSTKEAKDTEETRK